MHTFRLQLRIKLHQKSDVPYSAPDNMVSEVVTNPGVPNLIL